MRAAGASSKTTPALQTDEIVCVCVLWALEAGRRLRQIA